MLDEQQSFAVDASPIDSLYLALVQCFGIILCGYLAGRLEVITKSEANGLNTFVGTFSLPALIFLSMAKLDFSTVNWKFLLAVLIAKSLVFFIVLFISLFSTRASNPGRSALFAIFSSQSNDFAIGYPMINALYKTTHPEYSAYLYLLAPISLVILNPVGFVLLEVAKRQRSENTSDEDHPDDNCQMTWAILKGIAFNPVLFMTILGILGNLMFNHDLPPMIGVTLEVLGNAFSATALFLLGLMMVGKIHRLRGAALVIPGILISVKLLVLPLVIRESVVLIGAGENSSDTSDLSTFGFLYGTIPTAPALFIFSLRYSLDIDLIASSVVACTFLSAPLMFLSAKLVSAMYNGNTTPAEYAKELRSFALEISVGTVAASVWLLICFFVIKRKRLKSVTHRCTISLVVAQLISGVGVLIWAKLDLAHVGTIVWYIQISFISVGAYASRIWTGIIAFILLLITARNTELAEKLEVWFYGLGWGTPLAIVTIMCLTLRPKKPTDLDLKNPNFQFGWTQEVVSLVILLICFFITLSCLIVRQRYQRRHSLNSSSSYSSLVHSSPEDPNPHHQGVVDVEDLVNLAGPIRRPLSDMNNECASGLCSLRGDRTCSRDCDSDNEDEAEIDACNPQILRHLVLIILLLCSVFVGLAVTIATLIMEQVTGIYTELSFLDVALCFGQALILFAIFGLDPGLGPVGCWLRTTFRKWRIERELQLPDENSLSNEAKAVREQFKQCYLANCKARISACRRSFMRTYNGAFTGCDLVNWLIEAGVVGNREEAIEYGRCLLDSRVLNHVDGTQHFQDRNFLYTFGA